MALAGAPTILPLGKFAWLVAHGDGGARHLHRLRAGGRELGHAYATRWSGLELRKLLIAAGASAVAVFINPLGYRLVIYPFQAMFGAQSSVGNIQEFASIDFQTPWGKVAMILILGTLLISVFSQERWRLDELGLIMLALYFSLTNIRFMFLAAILAPPVFAKRVKLMTPYDRSSDKAI